ncbi:MAG TPA: PQQ-binding-like beta-propeller repeat protein [Acidobacteriota bacterium]
MGRGSLPRDGTSHGSSWVAQLEGVEKSGQDRNLRRSATPPLVRKLQKYARFTDQNGWPCLRPPWGTLNAIDLNSGEIVWKVPLGEVAELTARGMPKTGVKNLGGSIATAGGLVFIGATVDSRFRAFDSRSGEELWSVPVDAPAHATPVTYLGKSGRQFVVIAAGGGGYFSGDKLADSLIAYALPK